MKDSQTHLNALTKEGIYLNLINKKDITRLLSIRQFLSQGETGMNMLMLRSDGYDILGEGYNRIVVELNGYAVKIAKGVDGVKDNLTETKRYRLSLYKHALAQVHACLAGGQILVMEKCEPIGREIKVSELPNRGLIFDQERENFGVNSKGDTVIIDYAR
jgi:hypothetical protein